jgi:aminoglycoside phosphotransferase (APT) family kinase protein
MEACLASWIAGAVGPGSRIVRSEPMGTASTEMVAVDVEDSRGAVHPLALRRFVDAERLATDPWYVPAYEARALELLARSGVPAPRLLGADLDGEIDEVPVLLQERMPGTPPGIPEDRDRFLIQLAEVIPLVHAVEDPVAPRFRVYAPYEPVATLVVPPWAARPDVWERAFEIVAGKPPSSEPVRFIHRDLHPTNTHWVQGTLVGVVDWTAACWGPAAIDLARMRLNLVWDYGGDWAERFLEIASERGVRAGNQTYWDLVDACDALGHGATPENHHEAEECARSDEFVTGLVAAF